MDAKIIISVIIFIILVSFQYTLNLILRELREIKKAFKKKTPKTCNKTRRGGRVSLEKDKREKKLYLLEMKLMRGLEN